MLTGYCSRIEMKTFPMTFFWEVGPTETGENTYHVDVIGI